MTVSFTISLIGICRAVTGVVGICAMCGGFVLAIGEGELKGLPMAALGAFLIYAGFAA